jgi:hypothetical protein
VPVPISDADRAKPFDADQAGLNVDLGFSHGETFRGVQLTPPGSACSIAIALGVGVVDTAAALIQGLHLVVNDIHTARKQLIKRGVDVGGVQDMTAPGKPAVSCAPFTDPDGNGWTLQKLSFQKRQRGAAFRCRPHVSQRHPGMDTMPRCFVDRVTRSTGKDRDRANVQNKASDLWLCREVFTFGADLGKRGLAGAAPTG